jgi:hypothetical protein
MNTPPTDNPNRQGRRLRPYSALPQGFLRRPEAMRLSDKAKLLYWSMFDHACEQLTDGLIEGVVLPMLYAVTGASDSALAELTKGQVVKRDGADYQIVDFLEYNRSRDEREGARTVWREKKARQRRSDVPPPPPPPVTPPVPGDIPGDTPGESPAQRERESKSKSGDVVKDSPSEEKNSLKAKVVFDEERAGATAEVELVGSGASRLDESTTALMSDAAMDAFTVENSYQDLSEVAAEREKLETEAENPEVENLDAAGVVDSDPESPDAQLAANVVPSANPVAEPPSTAFAAGDRVHDERSGDGTVEGFRADSFLIRVKFDQGRFDRDPVLRWTDPANLSLLPEPVLA